MQRLEIPITVGVVGLGRAGWSLHLEPMCKLSDYRIVAVADPLPERRAEAVEKTGCADFASIDELLQKSDARIVVVATPSSTHFEDVSKVLQAGRHCIAEKPLTLESAQADELVALAKEKGLGLFVHHALLHRPDFHHFKRVIDSGILGRLFSIRICWGSFARRWDWQTLRKNGGGALNNTCAHVLSVVLPLLGEPAERAFADLRNIKDAGDAEDHVHMVLQTRSGITADIVVSTAMALSGPQWTFFGDQGAMISDEKTCTIRYFDGSKVAPLHVLDAAAPGRQYLGEELPWKEKTEKIDPLPVKAFHENIVEVLTGLGDLVVTPESAAEVVRVTNLVRAAYEKANRS